MPRRDALCDVATCAANWLARFSTQPRTSKIIYIKNKTHTRTTVWMLSVRLVNFRKMRVKNFKVILVEKPRKGYFYGQNFKKA